MWTVEPEALRLPGRRRRPAAERLWREWCFLRVALHRFRVNLLLLVGLLVVGAALFILLEPDKHHSLPRAAYYTWVLIFGQPPEDFPSSPILQAAFFIVPLVGLVVILEGLVDFALVLRDRRSNERSWCKAMATSLSDHIVLVGLGKLGVRTFRLLRELGEAVVVIERNPTNQFVEDVRRDGSPLFIGDARREAFLVDANAVRAKSIVLATNDDLANLEIALDARRINPGIHVVLRMFDQNMADKVRQGLNLETAMSQSALSAPAFVMAALQQSAVSGIVVNDQLVVMQRVRLDRASPLCGKTVAEVLAQHAVGIVERRPADGPPRLMPPPETRLNAGDEILAQGTFQTLQAVQRAAARQRCQEPSSPTA